MYNSFSLAESVGDATTKNHVLLDVTAIARFNPTDTEELVTLQRQILTNAEKGVRESGHLVYATCSWQVSENEAQVKWFLEQHPHFSLVSQTMLGAPQQDSDAMFVAVLQKN